MIIPKRKTILAGVLVSGTILSVIIWALLADRIADPLQRADTSNEEQTDGVIAPLVLDTAFWREEIMGRLAQCESTGNQYAINPRDRDGTPSFGLFQFKPSTLRFYGAKYKVLSPEIREDDLMAFIFSREIQEIIVKRMIDDSKVDKTKEFPVCWRRITGN